MSFCDNNVDKQNEIQICIDEASNWLPKMASESNIISFIEEHKDETNNIGSMMKLLRVEFSDGLDGKMASQLVKKCCNYRS